jgi:hypothetical protein
MIGAFSFVHDQRTYTCCPEPIEGDHGEIWWWFTVTHDRNRYAPFLAHPRDTRASTQARIVAYYANHLAHRAPDNRGGHWARRGKAPGAKPVGRPKAARPSRP